MRANRTIKALLPKRAHPALRKIRYAAFRAMLPMRCWLADQLCKISPSTRRGLPPAKLRFRVAESTSAPVFLQVGEQSAKALGAALLQAGYSVQDFGAILDFGCGSGRTLMWVSNEFPEVAWHGTDVDLEAVEWCQKMLPSARFASNGALPPLSYSAATFDLIYGISVFTHLSKEYQRLWIPELHRVLKPGGLLMLTLHGEHVWRALDYGEAVEKTGFVFNTSPKLEGILPAWYQTAFQTYDDLVHTASSHFSLLKHIPRAFGDQDAFIFKRNNYND